MGRGGSRLGANGGRGGRGGGHGYLRGGATQGNGNRGWGQQQGNLFGEDKAANAPSSPRSFGTTSAGGNETSQQLPAVPQELG